MRLFNRISTVAAVLAALAFGGHASAQSCTPKLGAADLITAGTLQLSINPTLPPQQYVDEKGELQGLNVELARALGAKLCLKTEFVSHGFPCHGARPACWAV